MVEKFAIVTAGLVKTFRGQKEPVLALRGVNLEVPNGGIFGFLGPNGAGKTTLLRILTTLLPFEEGNVRVADVDVKKEPEKVRTLIGYVSQKGGADSRATGWENLILQGRLYGLDKLAAVTQATNLIEHFCLQECIHRFVEGYSGGQRRRLDIALAMMHSPKILFLDEPTNGLDPQSRDNLWSKILQLKQQGITVFLTSHYLDEVDALADTLAIMDHGTIVAYGSPVALKKEISGDIITIGIRKEAHPNFLSLVQEKQELLREYHSEEESFRLHVDKGVVALPHILRLLDQANIPFDSLLLSAPSLNDVFLKKTGRSLREEGTIS